MIYFESEFPRASNIHLYVICKFYAFLVTKGSGLHIPWYYNTPIVLKPIHILYSMKIRSMKNWIYIVNIINYIFKIIWCSEIISHHTSIWSKKNQCKNHFRHSSILFKKSEFGGKNYSG